MAELRSDVRHEHVMMSVGNKVEVNLNSVPSESRFMLDILGKMYWLTGFYLQNNSIITKHNSFL